jgi:hypothetical protein
MTGAHKDKGARQLWLFSEQVFLIHFKVPHDFPSKPRLPFCDPNLMQDQKRLAC